MIFSSRKQRKRIKFLIKSISAEVGVDETVVLHFVNSDLERILNDKIHLHRAKLQQSESEFKELLRKENELITMNTRKLTSIQEYKQKVQKLLQENKSKSVELTLIQEQFEELQAKLSDLNQEVKKIDKKKKQVEYNIMMKSHVKKETTDVSFRKLGWILTAFTVIAIIIATILIYRR